MPEISAVSICSNALLLLGDKPIDSFDINNDRTRLVANLYTSKRDKVLRAHPWKLRDGLHRIAVIRKPT